MISFNIIGNDLIMKYKSNSPITWIKESLKSDDRCTINKTFIITEDIYLNNENDDPDENEDENYPFVDEAYFKIASIDESLRYFKFSKEIFGIEFDIYIQKDYNFKKESFIAATGISIFRRIGSVIKSDFYIGDYEDSSIPIGVFDNLVNQFPNQYEISKYANARISSILSNHFENVKNEKEKFEKYLNKKESRKGLNLTETFEDVEKAKYLLILEKIKDMLKNESSYNENQWQKEILSIIQLLYPKYISAFEEVHIKDIKGKMRRLDFMLLDSNGNMDIIEIKKPYNIELITPTVYRDNYIPLRELSGAIMQIEKYIYYLNKWGLEGEKYLHSKFKDKLPKDLVINIINPQGIIIMGRDNKLNGKQISDFEIIKRKYKHIIDIITYDDLVRRLELLVQKFSS